MGAMGSGERWYQSCLQALLLSCKCGRWSLISKYFQFPPSQALISSMDFCASLPIYYMRIQSDSWMVYEQNLGELKRVG